MVLGSTALETFWRTESQVLLSTHWNVVCIWKDPHNQIWATLNRSDMWLVFSVWQHDSCHHSLDNYYIQAVTLRSVTLITGQLLHTGCYTEICDSHRLFVIAEISKNGRWSWAVAHTCRLSTQEAGWDDCIEFQPVRLHVKTERKKGHTDDSGNERKKGDLNWASKQLGSREAGLA